MKKAPKSKRAADVARARAKKRVEDWRNRKTEDTYKLTVSCCNCGWPGSALLAKGQKPWGGRPCPNCGLTWCLNFRGDPQFAEESKPKGDES